MAAAALTSGGDSPAPRRTLAFSLSLLIHLAFVLLIFGAVRHEVASPPLEISIIEGLEGAAASGQPGEEHADAGPLAPARAEVKPVEAPPAPAAPKVRAVPRPKAMEKPAELPVAENELLAASPQWIPTPMAPAFEGALSGLTPREVPGGGTAPSLPMNGASRANAGGGDDGAGTGGFSISGEGRSYASIWQATQRYLAGLRWAYNNELRANASLRGVIVVRYEILADGAVGDVAMVSSQLRAPRLEQQVLNQIRDWRYPPEPTGTVVVTWPFSFLPPR